MRIPRTQPESGVLAKIRPGIKDSRLLSQLRSGPLEREGAHPPTTRTITVTLLDFPRHPIHSLSTHLSGKIPVKGSWASTLRERKSENSENRILMKYRCLDLQKEWALGLQDRSQTMEGHSETLKGPEQSWPVIECRDSQLKDMVITWLSPHSTGAGFHFSLSACYCGSLAVTIITDTEMSSGTQPSCSREDLRVVCQFFYELRGSR